MPKRQQAIATNAPTTTSALRELIDACVASDGPFCDLNHIDVSGVDDFTELFYRSPFMGDISRWDVSHVRTMRGMFEQSQFTTQAQPLGLANWDVSRVTDMSRMFNRSAFDGDISRWNVSSVSTMEGMFWASKFNGELARWDVSNVENMGNMFDGSAFNQDISQWNTTNVQDMANMFFRAPFDGDVSGWKLDSLRTAANMFAYSSFKGTLADWNVSNVQNMQGMFEGSVFCGDLSKWNVSALTNATNMFKGSAFVGNIQAWFWPPNALVNGMFDDFIVASGFPANLYHWHLAVVLEHPEHLAPEHRAFLEANLPVATSLGATHEEAARLLHTAWLQRGPASEAALPLPELAGLV